MYGFQILEFQIIRAETDIYLQAFDEKFKHSVKQGNNRKVEVAWKWSIKLLLNNTMSIISEVYYAPCYNYPRGLCKIYHLKEGLLIESGMSINRMFILSAKSSSITETGNFLPSSFVNHLGYGMNDMDI